MMLMTDLPRTQTSARKRLFLTAPAGTDQARHFRHAVTEFIHSLGWPAQDADDITLAVGEALNNAVSYGDAGGVLSLLCYQAESSGLQIEVRNTGGDFLPDLNRVGSLPDDFSTHGRGFALMLALMDDVRVFSDGRETVVSMTRCRTV